VLFKLVKARLPHPPVFIDPLEGLVEPGELEMARPELGVTGSRDQAAAFEHLQVLGDTGQRHLEGRSQLVDGRISLGEASHDRTPRRVSESGESSVKPLLGQWHGVGLMGVYFTDRLLSCQVKYCRLLSMLASTPTTFGVDLKLT
jgi:hypothetical protein